MDQDPARRVVPQGEQPKPYRGLARIAARNGDDPVGIGAGRPTEEIAVVGMDGDDDLPNSRMRQERVQRACYDGAAADALILLRPIDLSGPRAATGSDDHHRDSVPKLDFHLRSSCRLVLAYDPEKCNRFSEKIVRQ